MIMKTNVTEILSHFIKDAEAIPFGNGHINDTFLIKDKTSGKGYIFQKINMSFKLNYHLLQD